MSRPIHPLTGADLATVARLLTQNGPPRARHLPSIAGILASAAARQPTMAAERIYVAAKSGRRARMPAPVFIVGHWRSGTTHLFNLLSASPEFTYAGPIPTGIPWDFLLVGRALAPLLKKAIPAERYIDSMSVTATAPQEDEIALAAMTRPSFFHGVYFPSRFGAHMRRGLFFEDCGEEDIARWQRGLRLFTEKTSLAGGGRRVLIKNPAHTGRIRHIREIWPDARFVHIVRDPYEVYQSNRRMFARLLDMVALQDHDAAEVETVLREVYPRMMDALVADTRDLPENRFVEVRFETLEADPLGEIGRVADRLELQSREDLLAAATRHLDSVADHRKATREAPPDVVAAVDAHWGPQARHWGYAGGNAGAGPAQERRMGQ